MKASKIPGVFQYLVLRAIQDLRGEVTTNEISLWIEGRLSRKVNPGQLYPAIARLEESGHLDTYDDGEMIFTLTNKGRDSIEDFEAFMLEILK